MNIPTYFHSSKINSSNIFKKSLSQNNDKTLNNVYNKKYLNYQQCRISQKSLGLVKSFVYNTYKRLIKDHNEDRVIVISKIPKPHKTIH